ncbi:MAG: monovalent cation/H(+) antiporter subunit G [Chloroflexi bacterium]|nr:monovalent cation/H(+) antiporter subunit G [Chloroflexota bacterium]
MLGDLPLWLADALVVLGVTIMTIGVYGVIRMPDLYTQLHAASKSVFVGVVSLCFASIVTGDVAIVARVFLIAVLLLLTTPVSAHVIARGAYLEGQRMETPGAIDESGQHRASDPR